MLQRFWADECCLLKPALLKADVHTISLLSPFIQGLEEEAKEETSSSLCKPDVHKVPTHTICLSNHALQQETEYIQPFWT